MSLIGALNCLPHLGACGRLCIIGAGNAYGYQVVLVDRTEHPLTKLALS